MRQRLFEPFASSKPEDQGAGLGLYISRNIVEELGGVIRLADSEAGARFVVELPIAGEER
jgi:C4-dicarboxylate-specific signal transduction histidine kinase